MKNNFQNQFILIPQASVESLSLDSISHFKNISLGNFSLFACPDLPLFQLDNGSIFLGDLFFEADTSLEVLNEEDFLSKVNNWPGRWTLFTKERIYSEFLGTKALFFTKDGSAVSSTLGLLRILGLVEKETLSADTSYRYYLPPGTPYENVLQVMPGQYFDLNEKKAISFSKNYFTRIEESDEKLLSSLSTKMFNYVDKVYPYLEKVGYLHALTGGLDSRLSMTSFSKIGLQNHTCFTHTKPYFFMSRTDSEGPKELKRNFNLRHEFTRPNSNPPELKNFNEYIGRNYDSQIGSNFYYLERGQLNPLKGKFFIDNYYETGARWMFGKGSVGKAKEFSEINFQEDGYLFRSSDYSLLMEHLDALSAGWIAKIDALYFVKNFATVAKLFCELDFICKPIVHMNSREFFSLMLSTSEEFRTDEKMLNQLLELNLPEAGKKNIPLNQEDFFLKEVLYKTFFKLKKIVLN